MRPGQLTPNELELAILERLVSQEPRLEVSCGALHVLGREYTGVGSFTRFLSEEPSAGDQWQVSLNAPIAVPGLVGGLGALLFCRGPEPDCLEIFAYGDEPWDGTYHGFSIE